jgi:hypothetical protein
MGGVNRTLSLRRADRTVPNDATPRFPRAELDVGLAWANREAAINEAKTRIDYLNRHQ